MARLNGKNAVITGGSSGIGLATARLLQAEGARVAITGRNPRTLEEARRVLGEEALLLVSDTARGADIEALAEKLKASFGGIDVLFVNAGIARFAPFDTVTAEAYDEILDVNTKGAFFTVQKLAPLLRPGAGVVLNTSVVDEKGMPNTSVYSASKAALRSLARTLAAELLPRQIRVNAVSPGPILTPIFDKLGLPAEARVGLEDQFASNTPMKRLGQAEEVASAVLYLATQATYTTGAELPVDGGMTQL